MKMKIKGTTLTSRIGLVCLAALITNCSWGKPLPPDKLAFVGLWKTSTGYGLDFKTNGLVKITEDYRMNELKGSLFERDWNDDNVPIEPGPGGSGFFLWNVDFQNDDFLLIYGPGANRRYKINIYPYTETNQTKMFLNGMEFTRMPREGLSTPVPPSDPLDVPIANKVLAARIKGVKQMTNQNALAELACSDKDSAVRKAALRKLTDPVAIGRVACQAGESDIRWLAINKVTDPNVLMEVARQYHGWDYYLNEAAVEHLNDQAALAKLARDATNWPGLWGVRNLATSKLTDQAALARVACEEGEPQICRTAVRGLTNQDLLLKVVLHGGDFYAVRKQGFGKLDPAHLTALAAQTKDQGEVIASKIKIGELSWEQVFSPESVSTNGPGNIVGAAALVDRPQPETNAVVAVCRRLVAQGSGSRWPELIDLLNRFGDRALAEDYLNSGESQLKFSADRWANNHGYHQAGSLHPNSPRRRLVANDEHH